jgi:hypothetical protein
MKGAAQSHRVRNVPGACGRSPLRDVMFVYFSQTWLELRLKKHRMFCWPSHLVSKPSLCPPTKSPPFFVLITLLFIEGAQETLLLLHSKLGLQQQLTENNKKEIQAS